MGCRMSDLSSRPLPALLSSTILKLTLLLLLCVQFTNSCDVPERNWKFFSGADDIAVEGRYTSPARPGSREAPSYWGLPDGYGVIFGGYGLGNSSFTIGYLSDLWVNLNDSWYWIGGPQTAFSSSGTDDSTIWPSARSRGAVAASARSSNTVYLVGGLRSTTVLNDVWSATIYPGASTGFTVNWSQLAKYNDSSIPTNSSTGAKAPAAAWIDDAGKLWVFGGFGIDSTGTSGVMNDMWVLDLNATQQGNASWEFVSGSLEKNQPGDISTPSSREGSVYWVDPVSGSLWLFGGRSRDSPLNDLWHFSPDTRVWTRIAQNSTEGSFGDLGVDSPGNWPPARTFAAATFDPIARTAWIAGGRVITPAAYFGDVWTFNVSSGHWTWVAGSNTTNTRGNFASATPSPGSRGNTALWLDNSGSLNLFGGRGYATHSVVGQLADSWRMTSTCPLPPPVEPPLGPCPESERPNYNANAWTCIDGKFTINDVIIPTNQPTQTLTIVSSVQILQRLITRSNTTLQVVPGRTMIELMGTESGYVSLLGRLSISIPTRQVLESIIENPLIPFIRASTPESLSSTMLFPAGVTVQTDFFECSAISATVQRQPSGSTVYMSILIDEDPCANAPESTAPPPRTYIPPPPPPPYFVVNPPQAVSPSVGQEWTPTAIFSVIVTCIAFGILVSVVGAFVWVTALGNTKTPAGVNPATSALEYELEAQPDHHEEEQDLVNQARAGTEDYADEDTDDIYDDEDSDDDMPAREEFDHDAYDDYDSD